MLKTKFSISAEQKFFHSTMQNTVGYDESKLRQNTLQSFHFQINNFTYAAKNFIIRQLLR